MKSARAPSVGRDMVELKLQQKLLKAKLADVERKTDKLNVIMVKKMMDKTSSMWIGGSRPEDSLEVGTHTVSEYRMPHHRSSGTMLPSLTKTDLSAVTGVGFGSDMDRIRIRHRQRTEGKNEVNKRIKEKEAAERRRSEKNRKRQLSGGNVPSSMFPNRYARGELPCAIEHGKGGIE